MEELDDKKKIVKLVISQANEEDDASDDCCEIPAIDFAVNVNRSFSDDDCVEILAQTGNVALRDYPHPRHLCGNFPFSRTEHEKYCSKCFCYVCEVAAPCSQWLGQNGHCHVSTKKTQTNVI